MNFLYPVFGLLHVSLATVIPVMVMTWGPTTISWIQQMQT
jgi:hypothetical protein